MLVGTPLEELPGPSLAWKVVEFILKAFYVRCMMYTAQKDFSVGMKALKGGQTVLDIRLG